MADEKQSDLHERWMREVAKEIRLLEDRQRGATSWKIITAGVAALWLITVFLGQRTLAGYDEQDKENSRAIQKTDAEFRSLEREFYALKSDVRSINEQLDRLAKDSGYLVNLLKERQR